LASSRTSPPITCLEDILNSPDHTMVFRIGTAVIQLFSSASNNTTGKTKLMQNLQSTDTTRTRTSRTPLNRANTPPSESWRDPSTLHNTCSQYISKVSHFIVVSHPSCKIIGKEGTHKRMPPPPAPSKA
jgi:hypothetical protein